MKIYLLLLACFSCLAISPTLRAEDAATKLWLPKNCVRLTLIFSTGSPSNMANP